MTVKKLMLAGVAVAALSIGLAGPALASNSSGTSYQADLAPITVNHSTGSGQAWITLDGNSATVKMTVSGLLDGSPHAQHIHIDGTGTCPAPAAAKDHNGNQALSTVDGVPAYGMVGTSLTTSGDTSPAAALAIKDFAATGSYTYSRTITLDAKVAASIKAGTAAVVVHGIDYNGNGKYDDVLGASSLDPSLPLEATAPALCGVLTVMQATPAVGSADTGGGSMAATGINDTELGFGALALFAAGGAALVAYRRRRSTQE